MTSSQPPSLAIIFVLYRNYDTMFKFLETQVQQFPHTVNLVIVDNTPYSKMDHAALSELSNYERVTTLIAEPENLGYAGAANFALQTMPELLDLDYIAISNTDLLYDIHRLHKTLAILQFEHLGVGAIAPRLAHLDGREKAQLHYVNPPSQRYYRNLARVFSFYPLALTHRFAADIRRKLGFSRQISKTPREIFSPHGSLMIMTKEYFEKTSGFVHPAFLFCEEITIGVECRDAGLKVIYEPRLVYSHENHGAMGTFPSPKIVRYLCEAHKAVSHRLS